MVAIKKLDCDAAVMMCLKKKNWIKPKGSLNETVHRGFVDIHFYESGSPK